MAKFTTAVQIIFFSMIVLNVSTCKSNKIVASPESKNIQISAVVLTGDKKALISINPTNKVSMQKALAVEFTIQVEEYNHDEKYVISAYLMDQEENSNLIKASEYLGSFAFFAPPIIKEPTKFIIVLPENINLLVSTTKKVYIQVQLEPINIKEQLKNLVSPY